MACEAMGLCKLWTTGKMFASPLVPTLSKKSLMSVSSVQQRHFHKFTVPVRHEIISFRPLSSRQRSKLPITNHLYKIISFNLLHTATSRSVTCGECSHPYSSKTSEFVDVVSCPKCGALQKVPSSELPNYFQILGHGKSFRVDVPALANTTKKLQKKFHPDLYTQKGPEQQNLSQEYSSLVNKALWTLTDPILRGRYMLTLAGHSPEDPDNDLEKTMTSDPKFLEEVMELNESLEEISSERDWKEFRSRNLDTMKEIQLGLEEAFKKDDLLEAQRLLGRMKYFDTLQHKLKEIQSRIGIIE